jgi:hypothetical protein
MSLWRLAITSEKKESAPEYYTATFSKRHWHWLKLMHVTGKLNEFFIYTYTLTILASEIWSVTWKYCSKVHRFKFLGICTVIFFTVSRQLLYLSEERYVSESLQMLHLQNFTFILCNMEWKALGSNPVMEVLWQGTRLHEKTESQAHSLIRPSL